MLNLLPAFSARVNIFIVLTPSLNHSSLARTAESSCCCRRPLFFANNNHIRATAEKVKTEIDLTRAESLITLMGNQLSSYRHLSPTKLRSYP